MNTPEIPWQPFRESMREFVDSYALCLWWVPIRGEIQVFTGRVAYWGAANSAMIRCKSGSMVRVTDGAFYAIITPPAAPPVLDDAIELTGSTATAAPQAPASLSLPDAAAAQLRIPSPLPSPPSPYPPGLD